MPAINVAKTDTFELQRQKINTIGQQIFSVTEGGSDLTTGNLKLGDGTLAAPSLAFASDNTLGVYKPSTSLFGLAVSNKRIINFGLTTTSYSTFDYIKTSINTANTTILNAGSNYDTGVFPLISLTGGVGAGALATVTVAEYTGTLTPGTGYNSGTYNSIGLVGSATGSGASIEFTVEDVTGEITNSGSGYTDGQYTSVPLIGSATGSGLTCTADVSGGQITITLDAGTGLNYQINDVLGINDADVGGGGGSNFAFTVTNSPNRIDAITFVNRGSGYAVNDVLTLPGPITGITSQFYDTVTGVTTTLVDGSAQITVADTSNIAVGATVTVTTGPGELSDPTTVLSVDNATTLTLSGNPVQAGSATLTFTPADPSTITIADTTGINVLDIVTVTAGTGVLPAGTTVSTVTTGAVTLSNPPSTAGPVTLTFSPAYGSGSSFAFTITNLGAVETVEITDGGIGYADGDDLGVNAADLVTPIEYAADYIYVQDIAFSSTIPAGTFAVGDGLESDAVGSSSYTVRQITVVGGNIVSCLVDSAGYDGTETLLVTGDVSQTPYSMSSAGTAYYLFVLDDGTNLPEITPNLTFYVGAKYKFNYTSSTFGLSFSTFRDGKNSPSLNSGLSATLTDNSTTVTFANTAGIVAGMQLEQTGGSGSIVTTKVVSVDNSTAITVEDPASTSGVATVDVYGAEYTDGVVKSSTDTTITVTDQTPTTLYYYNDVYADMGGTDNNEAVITVSANNPNTLGSGFLLDVGIVDEDNNIKLDIDSGTATVDNISATAGTINTLNSQNITAGVLVESPLVQTTNLNSGTSLSIVAGTTVDFSAGINTINFGAYANLAVGTGNITTTGEIKTSDKLNVNDQLEITGSNISSTVGNDVLITPAVDRITKIDTSTSLIIPVGNDLQRPTTLAQNGAIRFNTDSNQYEGYSSTSASWSSLGGVRDIDGNTYILAELTTGANDNTLWFYNDAINTLKLNNTFLDFRAVKSISSGKLGLPTFTDWASNVPVTLGAYVKYKNNLYEVTTAGTTATSGNEPTHTSGAQNNGTAELTWSSSSVDPLTFEEVSELRVGPNKDCPLVIGQELKLDDNKISTQVQDLIIQPNAGKQVIVDSVTHFRIPAGNNNQKTVATPGAGSIRFNTEIQQYEGYSGTNWSSLGGVRDVDGNTFIIPESAPAANENILYFYNNNVNTIQLTETVLDFTNIDTITTSGGTSLALDTQTLTLNTNDTTIDNSDANRTFISSTKQYLDLGLSAGLYTDPILRLDDQGDVYLNTSFGTGSFNGVKVLDGELKEFELADYKIKTGTFQLVKGGLESSNFVLYDSGTSKGCKVSVTSKSSSGKRSFCEYSVIDNGTDIFHNEYGSLNTSGNDQFSAAFDFTASTEPRITVTLTNDHATSDVINFTVLVQEIK